MRNYLWPFTLTLLATPVVQARADSAESAPIPPYVLSTNLPETPLSAQDCINVIRNQGAEENSADTQEGEQSDTTTREALETNQTFYYQEFNRLNDQIYQWQYGETDSLTYGQDQLAAAYEEAWNTLSQDDAFSRLSEDEQAAQVEQDQAVVNWQIFLKQVEERIDEAVQSRDEAEKAYQRLTYDLQNMAAREADQADQTGLKNSCLLLPYSVDYLQPDQVLLDNQNKGLSDYLLDLDTILQKLVPPAYTKVTFQNIYDNFIAPPNPLWQESTGKFPQVFDLTSLQNYTYRQDLNLNNVKQMAVQAGSEPQIQAEGYTPTDIYQSLIHTKEGQAAYFMAINAETWQTLKTKVADYLNAKALYSEDVIAQIKQLHDRYQVKLVLFDERAKTWQVAPNGQSGYLEKYLSLSLAATNETTADAGILPADPPLLSQYEDPIETPKGDRQAKLDRVKDKLWKPSIKNQAKSAMAPPEKIPKANNKEKDRAPLKLPSTGEQNQFSLIALILLLIGGSLLGYHRYQKYRQSRFLNKFNALDDGEEFNNKDNPKEI